MILIAAIAIALLATVSSQAITVKITDDPTGVTSPSSITMANGATTTLYVYMNGQSDNGTVFEGMLCCDNSTVQGSFGHGDRRSRRDGQTDPFQHRHEQLVLPDDQRCNPHPRGQCDRP